MLIKERLKTLKAEDTSNLSQYEFDTKKARIEELEKLLKEIELEDSKHSNLVLKVNKTDLNNISEEIISNLDKFAREYNVYEFGLPNYPSSTAMSRMINIVKDTIISKPKS